MHMRRLTNDKKHRNILIVLILLIVIISIVLIYTFNKKYKIAYSGELAKAMKYGIVEDGDDNIEGTNFIKFDAFFLRDLDGDGYAEKIRGTAKNIGEEDILYMELNVLSNGHLEDGIIEINSDNFYFQTAMPRDSEIKENAIGSNVKQIKLNTLTNGTQKVLTGMVRSGDYSQESKKTEAIGNDINKYSKVNSITLRGTQVEIGKDDAGNEIEKRIPIEKTINFDVDWYGTTKAEIPNRLEDKNNLSQSQSLKKAIDEENNEFKTEFDVIIQEVNNELILKKACIETEIPKLNEYSPLKVEVIGNNISYTYDSETRKLVAQKEAKLDENGIVISQVNDGTYYNARYNEFKIQITYPLEAYKKLGESDVFQELIIKGYYEGYNNESEEFINPYKSNTAVGRIMLAVNTKPEGRVVIFEAYIGKLLYNPVVRRIVPKENMLKVYNGISDTSTKNTYIVNWRTYTGEEGNTTGLVLKEDWLEDKVVDEFLKKDGSSISMEDISSNIGIYFSNPRGMLGDDGWIKIFDADTDELVNTFTSENWEKYSSSNPYLYEIPVKHIRVETSSTNINECLNIYHVKNIDTKYVTENISREEFDEIVQIKSIVNGYVDGTWVNMSTSIAEYEAPYSKADIDVSQNALSTQETKNNMKITIKAEGDVNANQVMWLNGAFLLKLPKEILDLEINNVTSSEEKVKIISYEYYEENEDKFIKINTENSTLEKYDIVIDCNITPDPRISTKTDSITLYSYNENASDYWSPDIDIYDVNDNLNRSEKVGKVSKDISFIAPNLILTNESITDYNNKGSVAISPQISILAKSQRTANINVEVKNNYQSSVSDIIILGRVPFENNKYVISGKDLGSDFSVQMKTEISMPEDIMKQATIYYSENGEATKDLSDSNNGWTTTPKDFSKVKSYLIDLGDYVFEKGDTTQLSYTIGVPEGLEYNQITYSHHAMYFSLNTPEGKYKTQVEPNKVGLMIGKEYDLEIVKYQTGTSKLVPGATYSITEEGEGGKTRVTDINGKLLLKNLYVDRIYTIKEIKSPSNYELNTDEIKFKITDENNQLKVNLISGNAKKVEILEPNAENEYRIQIQVEDEVKPSLKILKTERGTNAAIKGVYFKITGEGLPTVGKGLITNNDGEIILNDLHVGTEYTLKEIRANGYYLESPIKFKIENNNGKYSINFIEGNIASHTITEIDSIPTINLKIENTKIPTYNLQINKIVKNEAKPLSGVKFRLFKGTEKIGDYETNTDGIITINNLYQYNSSINLDQTYTLKEIYAPEGFSTVNDISFKVENKDGSLTMDVIDGNIKEQSANGNTIIVTIEDSPSFKLIKKDGETGEVLPGTKFVIYNIDDGTAQIALDSKNNILGTKETINGKEYYTIITNEKGEITANLKEGLYKAVEVKTSSDKYEITNNEYFFGIGVTRESIITSNISLYDQIGGTGDDKITSISKSNILDGGIYVGGTFQNSIQLSNGDTVESKGNNDIIIIKYNENGEIDWYKHIGENNQERIDSLTTTNDGGMLIGISVIGQTTLATLNGDYTTKGNNPILLIKYDIDGNVEWINEFEGYAQYAYIDSICETSNQEIAIGVRFCYDFKFNNGKNIVNAGDGYDAIVIKFEDNGKYKWHHHFITSRITGSESAGYIYSIVEASDEGMIIGGAFGGKIENEIKGKTETIECNGEIDAFISKFNNNGELEWYKTIGGTAKDEIRDIIENDEGKIIAGGAFSGSITLENGETITSKGGSDGILLTYDLNGNFESYKQIGGTQDDEIKTLEKSNYEGIFVGGNIRNAVTLENGETITTYNNGIDGIILKYDDNENLVWAEVIRGTGTDNIYSLIELGNDDILIAVGCNNNLKLTDSTDIKIRGNEDLLLLKLNQIEIPNIVTKQVNTIGGIDEDLIEAIIPTSDNGMAIAVKANDFITLEDGYTTISKNSLLVIKYDMHRKMEWKREIDDIGCISHIYAMCETNNNEIVVGITNAQNLILRDENNTDVTIDNSNSKTCLVNYNMEDGELKWYKYPTNSSGGQEIHSISATEDGGFIVAKMIMGKVQINDTLLQTKSYDAFIEKYDSNGNLKWYKQFSGGLYDYINSIVETKDGSFLTAVVFEGEITVDGKTFKNEGNGASALLLKLNKEGKLIKANQVEGSIYSRKRTVIETKDSGIIYAWDNKIVKLDSNWNFDREDSPMDHIYSVKETSDGSILVCGISNNKGKIVKYNSNGIKEWEKEFGKIIRDVIEKYNKTIVGVGNFSDTETLDNGQTITSNGNTDGLIVYIKEEMGVPDVQEITVENIRKEFKITTEVKKIDGIKGGSISGENDNPYEIVKYGDNNTKEIILTPDEGYEIIGITINEEEYQFTANEDGTYTMPKLENITEDKHIVVTYSLKENKIVINKIDSYTKERLTGAEFRLEKIGEEPYSVEIETNSQGQAITQIPFGKYTLTETKTPDGYEKQTGSVEIEFNSDGTRNVKNTEEIKDENGNIIESPKVTVNKNKEFEVENISKAKVIVEHYIKGTEEKIAEDVTLEGKKGENYTTSPLLDIEKYELEKDENGEYIIPENASGTFTQENIIVKYYYVEKKIPLTVHHYIEGTADNVPLASGIKASDETYFGENGQSYTTNSISNEVLSSEYELVKLPYNKDGIYTGDEIIVTYFYKKIERKVTIQKYAEDGITPLSGATFKLGENEYITNKNGKIDVTLEVGEYDITEIKAPEGYKLPDNPTTKVSIDRNTTEVNIKIINEKIKGTVTVHHYIKGTTDKVLLLDGTEAPDEVKTENVGSIYATSPRTDIKDGYACTGSSNNTSGTFIDGNIDVIYYYGPRTDLSYTINYLEKGTNNILHEPDTFENQTYGDKITSSEKVIKIDGYVYDSLEPEVLTISADNSKNIINIYYIKNETNLKVTKIWDDNIDENQKRPNQIKVIVKNGETQVLEAILTADNAKNNSDSIWEYTFEKLAKYDNEGKLINYTLEEQEVKTGDLKFYEGEIGSVIPEIDENGKTTSYIAMITNTFTVPDETIDIKVNKIWEDDNNANGKRPNSIKLIVSKMENEIQETNILEEYQSDMTIDSNISTNKETVEEKTTSEKIEENNSNTLSKPENTTNEEKINETVEDKNLSKNANDKALVNSEDLDKANTKNENIVTNNNEAKENKEDNKTQENNNSTIVAPETKDATSEITTEVTNDVITEESAINDNLLKSIQPNIPTSAEKTIQEKTTIVATHVLEVSEEDFVKSTWEYTFENLPKYDEKGKEIKYIVTEEKMTFYEATGGNVEIAKDTNGNITYTATLTNKFTVPTDTIDITVDKTWIDTAEQIKRRPESITIKLMNGNKELNQEIITAEKNWVTTFNNLAKYDDSGNEINYTISEEPVEFYTASYGQMKKDDATGNYTITVTNTFTGSKETIQIPVKKVWNDNNKDRLSSIILVLTGNEKEYTQTLTKENEENLNTWAYTFTNLPKYDDNGVEIVYTLSERETNTGDLKRYIQTVEDYTVSNTLIIKDTEIKKTGPEAITSLDEVIDYTINYKATIDESYTDDAVVTIIDTLPYEIDTEKAYDLNGGIYDNKNKTITWTEVMKTPIDITKKISLVYKDIELSDTTTTITNNVKGSIELTNGAKEEIKTSFDTSTNFTKKIILNKMWVGDSESLRPDSIIVKLKGSIKGSNENGEVTNIEYTLPKEISEVTINETDNWTYTWDNLLKYDKATKQEINYSIEEIQIPGYYNSLTEENNVFTLTNYKYGSISITKVDSKNKSEKLSGAEFKLEKLIEENGKTVVDPNFIAITQITSNTEEIRGQANFANLEYGKYRITETKAPEGYNLLNKPIDIEISSDNTDISLMISNKAKIVLPVTGGMGTTKLTIIGILAILVGIKLNLNTEKIKIGKSRKGRYGTRRSKARKPEGRRVKAGRYEARKYEPRKSRTRKNTKHRY